MHYFLVLSSSYTAIDVALYRDHICLQQIAVDKFQTSKLLISTINDILTHHSVLLKNINGIIVNQGPAPFTTLRVAITTANGLAFATGIPLIGVNGLEIFVQEYASPDCTYTVALLNAFNQDVYFAVRTAKNEQIAIGCKNYQSLLTELATTLEGSVCFIGNAVALYNNNVTTLFGSRAHIATPLLEYVSINAVAQCGIALFTESDNHVQQIVPFYLKQATLGKIPHK